MTDQQGPGSSVSNERNEIDQGAGTTRRVTSGSPFEASFGFCRAIRAGDRVLVAGTAPIWPDGNVVPDVGAQTRRCFEIVADALAEFGLTVADVVRTRMYIVDAGDADAVGAVHGEVFAEAAPVATMVVVAGLLDPTWKVEVEAEALNSEAPCLETTS